MVKENTSPTSRPEENTRINYFCFSSNIWRNKITNNKESDKCDLCKALWVSQGRFTTERALPIQTLGHIQHTCEALSELHTMAHHRCWRLIHGELSRLAPSSGSSYVLTVKNACVRCGKNWLRNFQRVSISEQNKRFGMRREI